VRTATCSTHSKASLSRSVPRLRPRGHCCRRALPMTLTSRRTRGSVSRAGRHVAGLALIILVAVGGDSALAATMTARASGSTITVTASANGHTVNLHRGDLLVVALRGNSGTGGTWKAKSVDSTILHSLPTQYVYDHPGMPGAGETWRLTFMARQAGTTNLQLVYGQPWEPNHPWQRVTLHVTVD
jgi:predicted secreted protein